MVGRLKKSRNICKVTTVVCITDATPNQIARADDLEESSYDQDRIWQAVTRRKSLDMGLHDVYPRD